MTTFNDALRAQMVDQVVSELMRLIDALRHSTESAIFQGDSAGVKSLLDANIEQFKTAVEGVVDAWASDSPAEVGKARSTGKVSSGTLRVLAMRASAEVLEQRNAGAADAAGSAGIAGTMTKRSDVVKAVQAEAERIMQSNPRITPVAARMAAWQNREDLAARYQDLPPEEPTVPTAPVDKGADAVAKATAKAREIQRSNPGMSLATARALVWEQDPALVDEFNRAISA